MFMIRQAQPSDLDDLFALAKQTYFINLPPDREIIASKIAQSEASFSLLGGGGVRSKKSAAMRTPSSGIRSITSQSDLFLLVLEDLSTHGVIGTSQIIAKMGAAGHPRFFMSLSQRNHSSRSLGMGWSHLVGKMGTDESGPTELGGLILNHAFRGHPLRLGRLLSFVRFHLIGLYREVFSETIIAEMLGPITQTGYNPFYEKFTRHFITRPFADVYKFSQTSREFVEALMPQQEMYLSILDPEVAHAAGEVSTDTVPARKILERLGFKYHQRIDPLDGGPHLEAVTKEIALVKATKGIKGLAALAGKKKSAAIGRGKTAIAGKGNECIVSTLDKRGQFRAFQTIGKLDERLAMVPADVLEHTLCDQVVRTGYTPLENVAGNAKARR